MKIFEFVCGTIDALLTDSSVTGYVIAGDFNSRPRSVRCDFICNCLNSHCPTIVDLNLLDGDSLHMSATVTVQPHGLIM